jgi:hypothetical protein
MPGDISLDLISDLGKGVLNAAHHKQLEGGFPQFPKITVRLRNSLIPEGQPQPIVHPLRSRCSSSVASAIPQPTAAAHERQQECPTSSTETS